MCYCVLCCAVLFGLFVLYTFSCVCSVCVMFCCVCVSDVVFVVVCSVWYVCHV